MSSTLYATFVDALRDAMRYHNISQVELARRANVHPITVNRLLNKKLENTTFELAEKLLDAARADKAGIRQKIC